MKFILDKILIDKIIETINRIDMLAEQEISDVTQPAIIREFCARQKVFLDKFPENRSLFSGFQLFFG